MTDDRAPAFSLINIQLDASLDLGFAGGSGLLVSGSITSLVNTGAVIVFTRAANGVTINILGEIAGPFTVMFARSGLTSVRSMTVSLLALGDAAVLTPVANSQLNASTISFAGPTARIAMTGTSSIQAGSILLSSGAAVTINSLVGGVSCDVITFNVGSSLLTTLTSLAVITRSAVFMVADSAPVTLSRYVMIIICLHHTLPILYRFPRARHSLTPSVSLCG